MWGARRDEARPGRQGRVGFLSKWLVLVLVLGMGCSLPQRGLNQDFAKGLRPASGDVDRLLYNAHYFKLMGRPQVALKELEEAYLQDPGNLKIANLLAGYYDELGLGERAQQVYQEALARDADNQMLNNNLCFSYYLAGKFSQAEACFRQTLARQPNNAVARNNLGLLLCRSGRQEEARSLWEGAEGKAMAAKKLEQALAALGKSSPAPGSQPAAQEAAPSPKPRVQAQSGSGPERLGGVAAAALESPGRPGAPPAALAQKLTPARPAPPKAVLAPVAPGVPNQGRPSGGQPEATSPKAPVNLAQPPHPILAPAPAAATAARGGAASLPARAWMPAKAAEAAPAGDASSPGMRQAHLTTQELLETQVEVRNGNGIPDLAREARHLLNLEGFDAVTIANHIDFGMEHTLIRYRPEAQKVARLLRNKFFANAEMQAVSELKNELDVQVILGHNLSALPQTVAKTAAGAAGEKDGPGLTHRDALKAKPGSRPGQG